MEGRVEPETHIVCTCARIYGTGQVNLSTNELSHIMRRQYTGIVTRDCLIFDFLQLKRLSKQSKIAKLPVLISDLAFKAFQR